MLEPLAYEFAPHQVGYPELPSITLGREVDRFNENASLRNSLAHNVGHIAQAIAIALVSFALIFGAGFGIAATIDQGIENWANTRIANVEP